MTLKAARRSGIPPFIVMEVLRDANRRQAAGAEVVHLEVGQPSTPAPAAVRAAAAAAVQAERLGYTDALGTPELRAAIAAHVRASYGIDLPAERVVATTGSSGGFVLAFLAAFEAGDRVALAAPGYPAYRNILAALGIEAVEIPTGPETRFQPTPELLEAWMRRAGRRLDGLIAASPANPTGTMIPPDELARLAAWCEAEGVRLVSDEIYHGIGYGLPFATAAAASRSAIVVNSFSKYFSMTGWRIGWIVVPEDLLRAVECLAQNLFICPPAVSQAAALAAFGCREELDANVARYAANRALLLDRLPRIGFDRLAPADGAFYLYADVSRLTDDSEAYCRRMLAETGVAATPGIDFDPARGRGTLRFSFAGSTADMARAADLLEGWAGRGG
jgi:aspartate/methionine/tyrosine aminotransferase